LFYRQTSDVPPIPPRAPRLAAVRIGLSHVKNLSKTARNRILTERSRAFFLSLEDFLDRAKLTLPEAEALADSGALDSFGHSRPETMWRIRLHRASAPVSFFGAPPVIPPALRDIPPDEKLRLQYAALDICAMAHPLAMTPKVDRRGLTEARSLGGMKAGARIKTIGWLVTAKRRRTKKGEYMKFLTLEDETGIYEAVLFPNAYKRWGRELRGAGPFVITGRVEDDAGYRTVTAEKVEKADHPRRK
jgi:error-prone DNA polymerase